MFTYSQSTGIVTDNSGAAVATGYSGNGPAMNDPGSQHIAGHGPLPQGSYTIGSATTLPHLGPLAMSLNPHPANRMFGRSGFFIHGDNASLNHSASDGCIILDLKARQTIAAAEDRHLTVIG
jgi:lipoprotein-anchoring transpeptidase ErfK/SrfK